MRREDAAYQITAEIQTCRCHRQNLNQLNYVRLMAEGKSYDWMDDDNEGYLPICWNAARELTDEYNRPERIAKE